jgi:small conductance mechanosensitive channel
MELTEKIQRTLDQKAYALERVSEMAGDLAVNLLLAGLILVLTFWGAGLVSRAVGRGLARLPATKDDATLRSFGASLARYGVLVVGLIAVLHRLGVETTSIIAVLGAASLAIGLALQGALSNVAAGVMILLFRPYRVGDVVTIAGKTGTVRKLDLFNTELVDVDGLKIVAPNAKGFGDVIVNYSDIEARRIELTFQIRYEDDLEAAIVALQGAIAAEPRLRPDPEPWVNVTELGPSSLSLTLRVWCDVAPWLTIRSDLLRAAMRALSEAGLRHAYPVQTNAPETAR